MSQRFSTFGNVSAAAFALDPSAGWSVCGYIYQVSNTAGVGDLVYIEPSANPGAAYAIRIGYDFSGGPTLEFRAGDGADLLTHTAPAVTGQWYHCAITYDGTTARAYLDGALVASQTLAMSGSSYNTVALGDFGTATVELAHVKVWEGYALGPDEVALEAAYWPPQSSPADVYAWWQLDAAAPTADSSGNSHTLSGSGSADGSFTPPGANAYNVAAVGTSGGAGTAAGTETSTVVATGASAGAGRAHVSTTVPTAVGGPSAVGGRGRGRRRAR